MIVGRVYFGKWGSGESPGEELVIARTDDDVFEVHCHGGKLASAQVLDNVIDAGGVTLSAEEWLYGTAKHMLAAEAESALARAATDTAAAHLLAQCRGALEQWVDHCLALATTGQLDLVRQAIDVMLAKAFQGMHLLQPYLVVVAGPPNVGKSLLINRLLGYERSIVFDQPGTTRDVLKTVTAWAGWLFELTDTAGMRPDATDPIERAGIDKARQSIEQADLVLAVADASSGEEWQIQWPANKPRCIELWNKCDLCPNLASTKRYPVSAKTGVGLKELVTKIVEALVPPQAVTVGDPLPFLPRHLQHLERAKQFLISDDVDRCLQELQSIVSGDSKSTRLGGFVP
jgi:tRNA modification GTPase